jgi:hypothetical protein
MIGQDLFISNVRGLNTGARRAVVCEFLLQEPDWVVVGLMSFSADLGLVAKFGYYM